MTSKSDDLERFNSLLELASNVARDTGSTFSSLQQVLEYMNKYEKAQIEANVKDLEKGLMNAYTSLCKTQEMVEVFNAAVNAKP